VTHDQNEALSLADQIAVMNAGRIEQVGTPQSVYESPANVSVAAFVGTAVLFPATVSGMTATCALGVVDVPAGSIQGRAEVLLRPEQIEVLPRSAGDGQPARVTDVAYFGHDATVHLLLESDATPVAARVLGTQTPEIGSQVRVKVAGQATPYPCGKAGSGDLLAV
jgi:iron(III) transport system ATP-binding protein